MRKNLIINKMKLISFHTATTTTTTITKGEEKKFPLKINFKNSSSLLAFLLLLLQVKQKIELRSIGLNRLMNLNFMNL